MAPHPAHAGNGVASVLGQRFFALLRKELRQMRRDKRVVLAAIAAPFIELVVFGFVLSTAVTNLPLGVLDQSRTPQSRDFISALTESQSFRLAGYYESSNVLAQALGAGVLDAGIVIPPEFAREIDERRTANVQFLLNATNANIAAIAQGYAGAVIQAYNAQPAQGMAIRAAPVELMPVYFDNPGLDGSWFIVTGILGVLFVLNGSMLSSTMMIKERSAGTIEQLLMSPATTSEIILAKIIPLFLLLSAMGLLGLLAARLLFAVPFHGSIAVVLAGAMLCILCGIALGMFVATLAKNALQAQLAVFFLNPPLSSVSGAFTPVEAMPKWLQPVTIFNPVMHFGVITRSALIKGSGFDTLWPNFLGLFLFALILLTLSIIRYRKQLA